MSLSTTGVWAVGVWATTVWADGVWFEGTPAPVVVQPSGGWEDIRTGKRKTAAQLRKEREDWGILPKKAKALIIRVAAQQADYVSRETPDTEALVAAFERADIAYREIYAVLLEREVERRLEEMREDEEVFLLLH